MPEVTPARGKKVIEEERREGQERVVKETEKERKRDWRRKIYERKKPEHVIRKHGEKRCIERVSDKRIEKRIREVGEKLGNKSKMDNRLKDK